MGVKQRMERVLSGSEFGGEGQLGGRRSYRRGRKYWAADGHPGYWAAVLGGQTAGKGV